MSVAIQTDTMAVQGPSRARVTAGVTLDTGRWRRTQYEWSIVVTSVVFGPTVKGEPIKYGSVWCPIDDSVSTKVRSLHTSHFTTVCVRARLTSVHSSARLGLRCATTVHVLWLYCSCPYLHAKLRRRRLIIDSTHRRHLFFF
jgi:hypothetical protein